jgi:uncharacterized protein
MLETIEKLLTLQERDRRIRRVQGELAHIEPERQMFKTKAAAAQTHLEKARERVMQIEAGRKALELEVETKKEQIARYSNQQFQTRKNEEYRALAHEIETCKQQIFQIEDQVIALMEQGEAAQQEVARSVQAARDARQLLEEQVARLDARELDLKKELAELQANRQQLAAAVDESLRNRYERLLKSKGENVVVGIERGVCGGCHMRVPPQLLVSCQARKELVTCSNCGRILYYTSDMDLAVAE